MRWFERHAWWLLLASAVISFVFGLGDLLAGAPDNALAVTGQSNADLAAQSPQAYGLIQESVRIGGIQLMAIGIVSAAILLLAFRRNLAWAWWTMWSLPVMSAALAVIHLTTVAAGQSPAIPAYSGSLVAILTAAALLLSAPRFFRRSENPTSAPVSA
jgi:hypothetical protein